MSVKVRLLFFAKARELVGVAETETTRLFGDKATDTATAETTTADTATAETATSESSTTATSTTTTTTTTTTGSELFKAVLALYPDLVLIKDSIILAHNLEYIDVGGSTPIIVKEGDEIAIIPPVSGG